MFKADVTKLIKTFWRDGFQRVLFAPCRKLRRDNPSKILVNLCVALAVSNLVFVAGMHPYALNNVVGCKVSTEVCGMVLKCAVGVHPLPTVTYDVSWTLLDPLLYRLLVGQNKALHASSAARNSAILISTFPSYSTSFIPIFLCFSLELYEAWIRQEKRSWKDLLTGKKAR